MVFKAAAKTALSSVVACAVMTVALIASTFVPQVAYAAGGGSLRITSTNGSAAEYRATHIADVDGLPIDEAFDWPALSGAQAPGYEALPTYNPSSATAAAQGRRLVERVSADLAHDEDGSLAQWLAANARADAPYITVLTDAAPVSVEDGWYLLRATGRRPLFAWVEGEAVTLGDKSDTPVIAHEVNTGDGWDEAAVGGSGRVFEYRTDLTVPHTSELYGTYEVSITNTHDDRLVPREGTLAVELLRPVASKRAEGDAEGEPEHEAVADLTDTAEVSFDGGAVVVTIANLHDCEALPGDVVRVTYGMTVDPLAIPGASGLANNAFATFPAMGGADETPIAETRGYLIHAQVHKVGADGNSLEGAQFAVRGPEGTWLSVAGSFGPEAERAAFTTDAEGLIKNIPALAPGAYELVELAAPKGHVMPQNPAFPFEVAAVASLEDIQIDVQADQPVVIEDMDGEQAMFTLQISNEVDEPLPGTGGDMPQTGETAWRLVASALAVAGLVMLAVGVRGKRANRAE